MYCSLLQTELPQVRKLAVAAVRGIARNKSFAEFQLEPWIRDQQVVDGILAQLTADERRKFRVGQDHLGFPSIELCPVREWCIVQSPHAVSVLCQSRPQSVVPEKQPLPPQLAVLVGWTSSLLCVDRAPPVGGGGPSSSTALSCSAAIPTRVPCAAPNVHVPAPPLLTECCSAGSSGAVEGRYATR